MFFCSGIRIKFVNGERIKKDYFSFCKGNVMFLLIIFGFLWIIFKLYIYIICIIKCLVNKGVVLYRSGDCFWVIL